MVVAMSMSKDNHGKVREFEMGQENQANDWTVSWLRTSIFVAFI